MAEATYRRNKLFVTDLPDGLELTGPQAYGMYYLWTGIGTKPRKAVITSLSKLRLVEPTTTGTLLMTKKGRGIIKDLIHLLGEGDGDE